MESLSLSNQTSMDRYDNNESGGTRTRGSNNPLCRAFKWVVNNKAASSFIALGLISGSAISLLTGIAIGSRSVSNTNCLNSFLSNIDSYCPPKECFPCSEQLIHDIPYRISIDTSNFNESDWCHVYTKGGSLHHGGLFSSDKVFGLNSAGDFTLTLTEGTVLPIETHLECNGEKSDGFKIDTNDYGSLSMGITKNENGTFKASYDHNKKTC